MPVTRVEVLLAAGRGYPIFIDADAGCESRLATELAVRGARTIGLVTDDTVARLHLPRYRAALAARGLRVVEVVVPDGESSKSLARAEGVAEGWIRGGLDRRSVAVALGGGVVGDLGGFVASIFLRGIPCVQVPTTLLAQVDSSVGGKTGVNLPSGKNLAGTFHQPLFVHIDLGSLRTLEPRDLSSGLAEVVKHGAILDPELFELLERRAEQARGGEASLLAELVARSCAVKAKVVGADEREEAPGSGGRALLNFGHTVGHALEAASLAGASGGMALRHGEAVALGMLAAARIGEALGIGVAGSNGPAQIETRLFALLDRLGLPTDLDGRLDPATLARVRVDKKRVGAELSFVVLDRIGSARRVSIPPERVAEILLHCQPK